MISASDQMHRWRTSSYSGSSNNCVQVATQRPAAIAVRDSKDPGGPALAVTPEDWRAFTDRVKSGIRDLA